MRHASVVLTAGLVAVQLAGCSRQDSPASPPASASSDYVAAAVDDETRPATARVQDAYRRPAEILAFSGLRPGDTVLEIAPAQGYFTALLSRVVGPSGRVIAVDSERLFEFMPRAREGFAGYIAEDPRGNVEYRPQRLDELALPDGLDQVWMVLFYHDTVYLGDDRAAMNRAFFEHLRPGGVYLVIDHHALAGAGPEVTKDLHRIDAEMVRREIEAAGFVLDASSDALAHPDDPRTDSVFAEERRGRSDQFVLRFVKPR
jgi:predicted methyltransferase